MVDHRADHLRQRWLHDPLTQARRRIGLTATLVREDGREGDVFSLIGPKRYDAPWRDIEAQGYIAPAECIEVRVSLDDEERMTYAVAEPEERYRIDRFLVTAGLTFRTGFKAGTLPALRARLSEPTDVLAHSLGTAVSHDALERRQPAFATTKSKC